MRQSDALLLIQNTDDVSKETIPSKVYEYLQAGAPILALVHENPELELMLSSRGHAVAAATDANEVTSKLAELHGRWLAGGAAWQPTESPYTVSRAVDQLVRVVASVSEPLRERRQNRGLTAQEWSKALAGTMNCEPPAAWSEAVARWVALDDSVLEIGAGTGRLARRISAGRKVLLDFSKELLEVAGQVVPEAELVLHDIRQVPWPFADHEFRVSYSVGVLEHFTDEEIVGILREQARVSDLVISLVPNAASLLYRLWKWELEKQGEWSYAAETPKRTLRDLYGRAGLEVVEEHTTDFESLKSFAHRLRIRRKSLVGRLEEFFEQTPDSWQGYLLVTVGRPVRTIMEDTDN